MIEDNEIIVDLFAGGGGASEGIRRAIGRDPDVAINHDTMAIAMHMANHPGTRHLRRDVWEVPPRWATGGRPVGLLWASPDCKHFSKAKGAAPTRNREIRSLAWVVEKWARKVRPRVIIIENVEEFKSWGPLDKNGCVISSQKGTTFRAFIRRLRRLNYTVEHRELRACDYGAPTTRKRLFIVARCDGLPIAWAAPTHGPGLLPYRTAAEIIDWSIPCPSIFDRKKPLAENTLKRIAVGIQRYVIESAIPFIVTYYGRKGEFRGEGMDSPIPTQTTENRFGLVVPHLQRQFGNSVGSNVTAPVGTITAGGSGKTALVTAFMAQHAQNNGGFYDSIGRSINMPISTITHSGSQQQIVTSHLVKLRGTCKDGQAVTVPLSTITSGGTHIGEVRSFLVKYYGKSYGQQVNNPLATVTTKDRLGIITIIINSQPYTIVDIGMRMLSPRELFRAQGFADDYQIENDSNGKRTTKADQVRCCGNSVCPPIAKALVDANFSETVEIGGWRKAQ